MLENAEENCIVSQELSSLQFFHSHFYFYSLSIHMDFKGVLKQIF